MRKSLKIGSYFRIIRILSARQCFLSCFMKRLLPCKLIQNIFSIIVFITLKSACSQRHEWSFRFFHNSRSINSAVILFRRRDALWYVFYVILCKLYSPSGILFIIVIFIKFTIFCLNFNGLLPLAPQD